MPENNAEQLDPSVLGERVGDDERAAADYPPEEPYAVDDPSITADGSIGEDDVATREERHVPDDEEARDDEPARGDGLIDPTGAPDELDDEERLLAQESTDDERGAESAAVNPTDQP